MKDWSQKSGVMQNKNRLKGSRIYLEHDYTTEERNIQNETKKIAKTEKDKGKKVKMGYRKLFVDGKSYVWSNADQGVVETKN